MNTINPHISSYNRMTTDRSASASDVSSNSSDKQVLEANASTSRDVTDTTVSILARQLSEAATRAGKQSADPLHAVTGDNYLANKARTMQNVPTPTTRNSWHAPGKPRASWAVSTATLLKGWHVIN